MTEFEINIVQYTYKASMSDINLTQQFRGYVHMGGNQRRS